MIMSSISNSLNLVKEIENNIKEVHMEEEDVFNVDWQIGSNNIDYGILTKKGTLILGHCSKEVAEHIVKVHNEYRKANKTNSRSKTRSKNAKR